MQISDRKARRLKTGLTIADMAKLAGADVWTTRDWEDRVTTRSRYHDPGQSRERDPAIWPRDPRPAYAARSDLAAARGRQRGKSTHCA